MPKPAKANAVLYTSVIGLLFIGWRSSEVAVKDGDIRAQYQRPTPKSPSSCHGRHPGLGGV
jgi:hypothetical protein